VTNLLLVDIIIDSSPVTGFAVPVMFPQQTVIDQTIFANVSNWQQSRNFNFVKTSQNSKIFAKDIHTTHFTTLIVEKILMAFSVWFILRVYMPWR
jgi:hypothetical protein